MRPRARAEEQRNWGEESLEETVRLGFAGTDESRDLPQLEQVPKVAVTAGINCAF